MSHRVQISMIVDQDIEVKGRKVNIHDIDTVRVDSKGVIVDAYVQPEGGTYTGWLSDENEES